jgi:amidase
MTERSKSAENAWRLSAAETADAVRAGRLSAAQATESALARLSAVNPAINAVVAEMPEEARATAAEIDRRIAAGDDPGPLAGVPITVKVNVDQAGHATTNGLRLQQDTIAETDNPVVANLRKAGAVIVGRTNTPAFSLRWFTRNSLHGWTRNPHDAALTPGGSSGGASAALAAGIGAIAHGSDIGGSIRYPAYACGLHGLRPSVGRVPAVNFSAPDRYIGGQIMAVSGPLARRIGDLRLALQAMSAPDARDPWHVAMPLDGPPLPKHAALCVAPEGMDVHPAVADALRQAAETLRAAGWKVTETDPPPLRAAAEAQAVLWLADFRHSVLPALEKEGDPDALFVFDQLERHARPTGFSPLMDALRERVTVTRAWQTFLAEYPILLLPVSGEPPFPDQLDVQSPEAFARVFEAQLTQVALPVTGLPALTVATGFAGTAPMGVQLVGPRFREDILLDAGAALEADGHKPEPIDPKA